MLCASKGTSAVAALVLAGTCWTSDVLADCARCARIADGTIRDSAGELLRRGFDLWGYNYQAHLFWGDYCDADRDDENACVGEGVDLTMKWNDAWLSNQDCDGDRLLDRHPRLATYRGSGAWLVSLMHGSYELEGRECHWFHMNKVEAAPLDAQLVDGSWYAPNGELIGPAIWGDFAITKYKLVDPCGVADQVVTVLAAN